MLLSSFKSFIAISHSVKGHNNTEYHVFRNPTYTSHRNKTLHHLVEVDGMCWGLNKFPKINLQLKSKAMKDLTTSKIPGKIYDMLSGRKRRASIFEVGKKKSTLFIHICKLLLIHSEI